MNGETVAQVHSAAVRWMEKMADDPRCQVGTTAIGNLLEVVRTALLVVKLPIRLGTTLSPMPERPRTDSVTDSGVKTTTITPQDITPEDSVIDSVLQPAVNIPSFSFTLAEPEPEKIPIQPKPAAREPVRCLATEFRNRIETLNEEDEDESYWYAQTPDQHGLGAFSGSYSYSNASPALSDHASGEMHRAQDVTLSMKNGVSSYVVDELADQSN
jgi:hypothetical protein